MQVLIIWLILRCLTSLFAGIVSAIRPMMPVESAIPFLPLTSPVSQWLERVFLSPWLRWDAVWYQRIVSNGYSAENGTAQFHPLYPWLATPLVKMGLSSTLSLLIISSLAGMALFFIFNRLLQLDLDKQSSFFGFLLFALSPLSFILFAPYSESLFLLFTVLCLFWARQKSWWLAGLAGGLAVLTRQQGIFLLLPMAWELREDSTRKPSLMVRKWKDWLALGLIPAGMLIWLGYRAIFLSDIQPNFSTLQSLIYSFLISPSATQVVEGQQFIWPWQALYISLQKLFTNPDLDLWVNLITSFLFIILLGITWRNMRISYKIYTLVITLISFSFYTGTIHPYMGLPRHLLVAFPVFIGLAGIIKKSWIRLLTISLSASGMLFLLGLYVLQGWIP